MRYLVGQILIGGKIIWQDMSGMGGQNKPSGLQISFPLAGYVSEYDILQILKEDLSKNGNKWLSYEGRKWQFNSADFKKEIEGFEAEEWLNGTIIPEISIDHKRRTVFDREEETTFYKIIITPDMVSDQMPRRIFLSHKGTNKPLVKNFAFALRAVGLTPWLDEEAMHAGVNLERGLIAGFNESCAAVFFVTPDFKDEAYLASEVNYAIAQKRKKGDQFSIITLVFSDKSGSIGIVPDLLSQYLWKEPKSDLEAFTEIVRALPIQVGDIGWRQP